MPLRYTEGPQVFSLMAELPVYSTSNDTSTRSDGCHCRKRRNIQAITVRDMQYTKELGPIISSHCHAIGGDCSGISKKPVLLQGV